MNLLLMIIFPHKNAIHDQTHGRLHTVCSFCFIQYNLYYFNLTGAHFWLTWNYFEGHFLCIFMNNLNFYMGKSRMKQLKCCFLKNHHNGRIFLKCAENNIFKSKPPKACLSENCIFTVTKFHVLSPLLLYKHWQARL